MYIEKRESQLREVIVESYYLCDKCNCKIEKNNFDAFEFTLELKTGNSYPEGGSGDKREIHLCPECVDVLFELLKNNNYRINESEWDY